MIHPYNTEGYALTLPGEGRVHLSQSLGIPLRLRPIPGTDHIDACGTYPISPDIASAPRDTVLEELSSLGVVSLVLVTDPFARESPASLDLLRRYKPHHIIEPGAPPGYSKHHRDRVRRGHRRVTARAIRLAEHLDDFMALYDQLSARHGFGQMHRFPPAHFDWLAGNPDSFPTFGAFFEDRLVSAHIFVRHEDRAYAHLAATDTDGYRQGAAYAVNDTAIRALEGLRITLGGAADSGEGSGLDDFKRGFANATLHSSLCGLVVDARAYAELSGEAVGTDFFPAYRAP